MLLLAAGKWSREDFHLQVSGHAWHNRKGRPFRIALREISGRQRDLAAPGSSTVHHANCGDCSSVARMNLSRTGVIFISLDIRSPPSSCLNLGKR